MTFIRKKSVGLKILCKLIDLSDGNCHICKTALNLNALREYVIWKRKWKKGIEAPRPLIGRRKIDINVDHIKPVSKGGTNEITNLALTHIKCNSKKGNNIQE